MFRKNKNPFKKSKEEKMIGTIKYSGAKLHEKGVILEIEGLQPNQYDFLIIFNYGNHLLINYFIKIQKRSF